MSETQIVAAILKALQLKGVWCWRVNSGMRRSSHKGQAHVVRLAPAGTPDIIGVVPDSAGQMFGLEVKTQTGRIRDTQQRWHDKARSHGVRVAVVRGLGEALQVVAGWRRGNG